MKIVIEIPDHVYEHAKNMSEDSNDEYEAMRAIAKGFPYEERQHGEWEKKPLFSNDYFYCSKCRYAYKHAFNFCPNCGSDNRPREKRNCDNCFFSVGEQCDILVPSENCKYWKPKV